MFIFVVFRYYIYADGNGNMFQCQTHKCTINANKEGEAGLLKKKKKEDL